jgi:penicillin-binding protein 2
MLPLKFIKFLNWRKKRKNVFLDPDEIFLDSKNLQNFDRQQFEGRIEKPIPKKTINFLGIFFVLIILTFGARLIYLQMQKGDMYRERSEENILEKVNIFTERGIIYDRNGNELAWNKKTEDNMNDPSALYTRAYMTPGFSHILGYVSYPIKDSNGNYWQDEFKGVDGLEKQYNDLIKGENGSKIIEINARGVINSENIVNSPKQGSDLKTSIDSKIQTELFKLIKNLSENNNFSGGAGIIMNVQNGEIITSTSFPEYDSEILSLGKDTSKINSYLTDKRKPFIDKIISGLYTPGSIVKPFLGLGALVEGVIDPYKKILSTGSISIPNPYFPDQKTVFKDWRANGWTDMAEALAVSSDVYFYEIGGGFENQKGLGIANIEKYAKLFGFGNKTGVDLPDETKGTIPNPEWKILNFNGDAWRIGDTYHTAIGQYGFQVTPIEMVRAVSSIANGGKLLTPHLLLNSTEKPASNASRSDSGWQGNTGEENQNNLNNIPKEYFDTIQKGMRQAVTDGTATSLNVPYVKVAVKTGTAQLGVAKNKVNSWVIGFFPYENPKYAFTVMMEAGPTTNSVNASTVIRELLDWMSVNTPEYFK